jgi:hypothetical protein
MGMSVAGSYGISLRPGGNAWFVAILISLAVHATLYVGLVSFGLASVMLSQAKLAALQQMKRQQDSRTNSPSVHEVPLMFVETDPTQAPTEAPKNPKFYSAHNSVAANPDAQIDTDVPKIDGTQTHVPKAETAPRSKALPLQPSAPKPAPPEETTEAKPKGGGPKPGDLALNNRPVPKPDPNTTEGDSSETPAITHQRPRRLEDVPAAAIAGEKMKQDGGVKRRHAAPSFEAIGTPFGEYDARIVAAISQHWYDLLDNQAVPHQLTGKVVVEFRLNYDGSITEMKASSTGVDQIQEYLCREAINEPAPYERWPSEMRRMMAKDYRELLFTFYYE